MTGTNLPRVPEGLRDLMKGFTKDVLREKPENLYEYSANYFDGIVSEKIPQPLRKYEPAQNYEAILKNRIRQQVPLSLVFNIIPETLTDLIKQFIKAVLKENPENIYIYAKEYFHQLSISKTTQNKTTKYSSYEKYLESKENVRYTTKVTCECGRVLSATNQETTLNEQNAKTNALIIKKDNENGKEIRHNANYLRAVCIIQRNVRKYLKRKKAKKNYNSHEYINAIYIIQRQFRRYLTKKRIASKNSNQHYDSVTYMRAVYVIQRHYRLYRKRQEKQKNLKNNGVSLSAAAFIIQRTFRRLIRARRAKKHTPAALDQGDDVNDNASDAGSYTSASTALLSTESAGEHIEFGGNYDESVHQQTIKEDEEVENNYVNFDEKHFEEPIKNEGQSINTKMWDSSIEYTGNDKETLKDNINKENIEIGEDGGKFVQSEMEADKKISPESDIKTKRILSGKDERDLKTLQEHKLSDNDLDATTIVSINNLNNQLLNEERTDTKTDQEVQKTKEPKKSKIASQVESFLDDAKKAITETLHLESSQKSGDNNDIDELNGVENKKEIVEPTIVKIDTKANESAIVKTQNEDRKQESEAKETAAEMVKKQETKVEETTEEIVNKTELLENNDQKQKEIEETIINSAEKSESNNNQLTIEKIESEDTKNGIEVETIVKETLNEVEKLKINDDQEKEVDKTIGNKAEKTETNKNQMEIGEMENKSDKKENAGGMAIEETMKSVEKSKSVDDKKAIEENEKTVETIEEKKRIAKREIDSEELINDTEEKEIEEPVTTKMESEKVEATDVQPKIVEIENNVNEPIIKKKDINETTTEKMEVKVDEPTNDKVKNEVEDPNIPKLKNKNEIIETADVRPDIVKIEAEVNEQIIDEKDLNEAATTKIKIEIDGPSDDNVNNEIEDENIPKLKNEDDLVETTVVPPESKKIEVEGKLPTSDDVEKPIEDLKNEIIEPAIVKEQNKSIETTKVELKNEMIESTEVKTENANDESTVAKMENIVEETILAKMAINKMSHKHENIQGDEILNMENEGNETEMKVKETPIAIDDESTDKKVEIKVEPTLKPEESIKLELVDEIVEQTTEKLENDLNEITAIINENEPINGSKDETVPPIQGDEKAIGEKENISDDPNINKNKNKSAELMPIEEKKIEDIKTTNVNVENNLTESAQQNEQITPNIEKTDREENEVEILKMQKEVAEPTIKMDTLEDAVTATEEVKGTDSKLIIIEPESQSHEPVKEEDTAEEKEQAKPLIDEAIDMGEKQTNETKESTFSKEDDPTSELVADLINKMDIKETQNEMAEQGTKIIENDDANEPINEKITKEINEPEVVKLDDEKDQQIMPKIESEEDKVAKKDEIQKDEPIFVQPESNVNESSNEPIIKKDHHKNDKSSVDNPEQTSQDDQPSMEKLEDSTKKQTSKDEESKVPKVENETNDKNINKIENEVKEIFGINNESNTRTTDSKPPSEDPEVSIELATERMADIVEKDSHVIDKRNTDIANSSAESQEAPTVDKPLEKVVAADTKLEVNTDSSLLKSNKLIGTQNFTNTSTNEIDNNTKKLPKDKHIGSSLESGRLIPTPIAELQLKSFKIPADSAPWYEPVDEYKVTDEDEPKKEKNDKVQADSKISKEEEPKKETNVKVQAEYNISEKDEPKKENAVKAQPEYHISDEDDSKKENKEKDQVDVNKSNNENANEEIPDQNRQSSNAKERVPKYFTGDETTTIKDPQVKNSISFFISFDSDDEKTTFKVPKKFLRNPKEGNPKTSETEIIEDAKDEQLAEESYPEMEDELEIEIEENDFQQFAASKLQTIPEVNESDSSNDLRYASLTVEQNIKKPLGELKEMVSNPNSEDLALEVNEVIERDSSNDLKNGSLTVEQDIVKPLREVVEMVSNPSTGDIPESKQSDDAIHKDSIDTIKTDDLIKYDNKKHNEKESSSKAIEMVQPSTEDLPKEIQNQFIESTLSVDDIKKEISDANKNDNDKEKHNAAVIIQNCIRAFLKTRAANRSKKISNDEVSQFSQQIAAKKIQRAYREYVKRNVQEKSTEKSLPEQNKEQSARIKDKLGTEMMAALIIQRAYRSYCERKKRETYEESTQGSITSSPMTAIRNLSISSELTSLESTSVQDVVLPSSEDCQSNKDIDSLDGGTTPIGVAEANIDAGIDTETIATARNAESTNDTPVDREHEHGLLESKFVPDTSNSLIDQNQIRSLEQDNANSNDLAISTDDAMFGLIEDLTKAPFAHLGSSVKETTAIREIVNEFLINEIQYSGRDLNLSEVQEEPCIRKTASVTSLCEGLDGNKTPKTGNITSESKEKELSDGDVIERQLTQGESLDLDGKKSTQSGNDSKQNESFEDDVIERQLTPGESIDGNKTPQAENSKQNDSSDGDVIERQLTKRESVDLDGNKSPNASEQNESTEADVIERQLSSAESIDLDTFATDTLDKATLKLSKPEKTIEKMSQRQVSELLDKGNLPTEASFEEPIIKSMGSLQEQTNTDIEDGDLIIYNRLQREDTRESSAQSDSVVFGDSNNEENTENTENINKIDGENTRVQFTRHYTIAGDDPRRMFKSVTIDDTVRYVEDGENDYDAAPLLDATNSFCLDDETSETIRKKIMAYSFSETDSDYFDPNKVITDDSFIDTAMADEMGTSTETESTIVSAATKIQAGARGFLTRRRLRRASAGTKSSTQDTKASFGNDAISESLERFIEEEAAKKIQSAYRFHVRKQKRLKNKLEMSSLESSLAARRQKLQRGDALRNDSTPDDDNSARTSITTTTSNGTQNERLTKKYRSETAATSQRKTKTSMEFKWPVLRQNSMPVQIDCEVLRVIPKHMRKRIKSAEGQKKKRK